MEFNKKRVRLPWSNWESVEISPDGIHTTKGTFKPCDIELLLWKANFYDRGRRSADQFDEILGKEPI